MAGAGIGIVAGADVTGILHMERRVTGRKDGVGEIAIAGTEGPGSDGTNEYVKPELTLSGKPVRQLKIGIEAEALGEALRAIGPGVVEGKIPAAAEGDAMGDVEVGRGTEDAVVVVGDLGVSIPESGGVVDAVAVGVTEGEIGVTEEMIGAVLLGERGFQAVEAGKSKVPEFGGVLVGALRETAAGLLQ